MFGFFTPAKDMLSPEDYERYRGWYCGLCRVLGKRHSQLVRFSLTYDMTFLSILLSALSEAESTEGNCVCPVHPLKQHPWRITKYTDYAADLSVILCYYKCLDNWNDDCDPLMLAASGIFKSSAKRILACYPRQGRAIDAGLRELASIENRNEANPDLPAACFGRLLGELFVYDDKDYWAPVLRDFGNALGRFIYLMDSVIDVEKDRKLCRYNPLTSLDNRVKNEAFWHEVLNIYLGDCITALERLPLLQDEAIIKNILCVGVWTQYNCYLNKRLPQKGSKNVSGSV